MSVNPLITHSSPSQSLYAPFGIVNGNIPITNLTVNNEMTVNIKDNLGNTDGTFAVESIGGNATATIAGVDGSQPRIVVETLDGGGALDHGVQIVSYTTGGDDKVQINAFNGGVAPQSVGGIIIEGISAAPTTVTVFTSNGNTATDTAMTVGNGAITIANGTAPNTANLSVPTVNGVPFPLPSAFPINSLTPGVVVPTTGTTAVTVANIPASVAGKIYRVNCVFDVTFAGTTALGDYTELQISGTGVSVFSMCTSTWSEIDQGVAPLIVPGNSKTASAVFIDTDGGGFNVDIIANSPTALFSYTFYTIFVERLN